MDLLLVDVAALLDAKRTVPRPDVPLAARWSKNMMTSRRLALLIFVTLIATAAFAQGKARESDLRTVLGTVVSKDESPVDSAVVYLKNAQTQDVRTYISDKDGHFRFSGLDLNVDYQIHAEHEGLTSAAHSVSTFDTRKEVSITLKIDHKKNEK